MRIRRGVINNTNNTSMLQTAQVEGLAGEILDDAERYQPFGLSTIPMSDAECVLASLGSDDQTVILAVDDRRYRPKQGVVGDVMLYGIGDNPNAGHDSATQRITLKANGDIVVKCGSAKFELLQSGIVNISATTLNIVGNVNTTGTLTNNGKLVGSTHTHGGVQTGSGTTSPPL